MTTTNPAHGPGEHGPDEHGPDERGGSDARRPDERGPVEHASDDEHGPDGHSPDARSHRGRRPARIDVVTGLALMGLVAALDLSLPGTVAAAGLAAVTGPLVRVDLAERRLPNVLVLVALVAASAGVVLTVVGGDAVSAAWACLLGLVVLAACIPLVHGGGLGAGDAKLSGVGVVAAALVSPSAPIAWLVAVALLGGVHGATAVLARRHGTSPRRVAIPFGPVLLVGWWLALVVAVALDAR